MGKQAASTGRGPGHRWGIILCLLPMLALSSGPVSARPDRIPAEPAPGVRVIRKVPFAAESFGEAHALGVGFPGLENPPHGEGDVVPPNAMGAAGPAHLVTFLNSGFAVFDKEGAKLDNVSLQAFWGSLGTGTRNRWGDFSSTGVDPSDNTVFWTLQEYARTPDPVSGESRWGTWWGTISPSSPSGAGGGGGCLSVSPRGGGPTDATSLVSVGLLLLPACALGWRRFFSRRSRATPFRHRPC